LDFSPFVFIHDLKMINSIIDIYHESTINFQEAFNGGVVAIIHKATQGSKIKDYLYHERREKARRTGFLRGGYHFSTAESVVSQVENFLSYAIPEDDELICLDWEPAEGPDMTLDQACKFAKLIKDETGRWPLIYGGDLLHSSIGHHPNPILSKCPLWYARYASSPTGIPAEIWPTYTLWQYTDGDEGPDPRKTEGVNGADRNIFQGSLEELKTAWPFTKKIIETPYGPDFSQIRNIIR
jgi:lysozyme